MPKPTRIPERIELPGHIEDGFTKLIHLAHDAGDWHGKKAELIVAHTKGWLSVALQSPAGEWRSMESAPTDGTIIEGYGYSRIEKDRNGDVPDVRLIKAWGSGKGWSALNNHSWFTVGFYPTHWRPYSPPAPTGEVAANG